MPSVTEITDIARISQYLAQVDIVTKGLFGGGIDRLLPRKLYCVRKNVEWLLALDSSDDTLTATSNLLYALCAPYSGKAQLILSIGGGGIIVNPSTGVSATLSQLVFQFVIGEPGALMNAGDTVLTLNYENIQSNSIDITLDGVEVPTNRIDRLSYGVVYSTSNTVITFSEGVVTNQLYIIRATQILSS